MAISSMNSSTIDQIEQLFMFPKIHPEQLIVEISFRSVIELELAIWNRHVGMMIIDRDYCVFHYLEMGLRDKKSP
jgi:hypothetical protein